MLSYLVLTCPVLSCPVGRRTGHAKDCQMPRKVVGCYARGRG
jgi:hypothetical protein